MTSVLDSLGTFFTTAGAFLLVLGPIVLIHEAGHYVVAKLFKAKVLIFSIGIGKRLWGFTRGDTDYRISLLPIGGFVRLGGEYTDEGEISSDPGDLTNKPRWQRILIYLAGPAMNFFFSIGLFTVLFMFGMSLMFFHEIAPVVGFIKPDSPAARAGLLEGDRIVAIDGNATPRFKDVAFTVATAIDRPLEFELERAGGRQKLSITPRLDPEFGDGDIGIGPKLELSIVEIVPNSPASRSDLQVGDLVRQANGRPVSGIDDFIAVVAHAAGQAVEIDLLREGQEKKVVVVPQVVEGRGQVGLRFGYSRKMPFFEALGASIRVNIDVVKKTASVIKMLFRSQVPAQSAIAGPLGMANYSAEAARRGPENLIYLIAMLSVSIGLMNLLPIPLLDGGHIVTLTIESVLRRDLPFAVKERFAQAGFMLLVLLMSVAFIFDLLRQIQTSEKAPATQNAPAAKKPESPPPVPDPPRP